MTTDLDRLIEAVEAGEADNFGAVKPGTPLLRGKAESAYNGSVDAAIALCEALLPGWKWGRTLGGEMWVNRCVDYGDNFRVDSGWQIASDPNPARALLLAVLRAKLTEMEDE